MNENQKLSLYDLVVDCETYGLTEKQAVDYVRKRTDGMIELSHSRYHRIKRYLYSEKETQNWFSHFARIGFVIEHRKRIKEMELLQKETLKLFFNELEKPEPNRHDKMIFLKLTERIESQNKRLSELSLGNPIISEIQKEVDIKHGKDTNRISESETGNTGQRKDPDRIF